MSQNKILVYLRRTVLRVAYESRTVTEEITDAIGTVIDNITRSLSADRTPTDIFTATDNLDYTQVIATLSGSFFVDTNHASASDSNPGTEALPWKTIRKAAQTLTAGQTCYVKNGTYVENHVSCSWTTPSANPKNSGTAGNPITFQAYPGHMPYVTNSVPPEDESCPVIGAKDRSYIVWSGFDVYTPGSKGIVVNSSDHVTITKCKVHGQRASGGANSDGIRIDNSDDCTFSDNYLYDIDDGDTPRGCGASGLKMYGSKRNIIENNEATDVGCGLRNKVDGQGNIFRYNWVHDCDQPGIHLGVGNGTSDHEVYNNVIARCETGVSVRGTSFSHTGTVIHDNTIVDIGREGISVHGASTSDIGVWSNILYDCRNSDINSSNNRLSYCGENCFYLTTAGCGISGNPDLVDPALNGPTDAQLQAGSICENAGRYGDDIGAYATGSESIGRTWS